ncbi:hypothetical protein BJY52DRAFT_439287 [Lactarius psammicola]|nr:hypothetical protein BJY52DRAFT_439287 [Lactarius psammicola]
MSCSGRPPRAFYFILFGYIQCLSSVGRCRSDGSPRAHDDVCLRTLTYQRSSFSTRAGAQIHLFNYAVTRCQASFLGENVAPILIMSCSLCRLLTVRFLRVAKPYAQACNPEIKMDKKTPPRKMVVDYCAARSLVRSESENVSSGKQ